MGAWSCESFGNDDACDWSSMRGAGLQMRSFFLDLVLFLVLALECIFAQAMCIRYVPDPNETDTAKAEVRYALTRSAAVFIGRVAAMEYVPTQTERGSGDMLVIRMKTSTWWKGVGSEEVRLNTLTYQYPDGSMSSEVHEYPYQLGKTYLVYAYADGDDLYASVCTRTRPAETAAEDRMMLDALKSE